MIFAFRSHFTPNLTVSCECLELSMIQISCGAVHLFESCVVLTSTGGYRLLTLSLLPLGVARLISSQKQLSLLQFNNS